MIAQKCPCVNNAPQNEGFCALSPSLLPSPHSFPTAPSLPSSHALCLFRSAHCPFRAPPHSFPAPPHTLLPCVLSRAPPHSPAPPHTLLTCVLSRAPPHSFPARHTLCSHAFCPALRRTPPRRCPDAGKDTQVSLPPCSAPLCTAFAHPFKRAKPLRPRRRGFSHCHVMFRRRLTPRRGRCKPAHRRRASCLQARSQPSTHPW